MKVYWLWATEAAPSGTIEASAPPSTYHVILLPVLSAPAPGLAQPLIRSRWSNSTEEECELRRRGSLETYQRDCLQFLFLCSNGNSFNTIQTWILRIVLFTYQLTVYLITLPHPHPHMCADVCAMYYKCIASCTYKSIGAPCYLSIAQHIYAPYVHVGAYIYIHRLVFPWSLFHQGWPECCNDWQTQQWPLQLAVRNRRCSTHW